MEWYYIVLIVIEVILVLNYISMCIGIRYGTGDGGKYHELHWFGFLNWNLLQWFGIRLAKGYEALKPIEINPEKVKTCRVSWFIFFPILPWTGWWQGYIPQKFIRIKLLRYEK